MEGGREDSRTLLLHFSGKPLLGGFSTTGGSSGGRSQLGFVDNVEENLVAMSVCPKVAWAGRMRTNKLVA